MVWDAIALIITSFNALKNKQTQQTSNTSPVLGVFVSSNLISILHFALMGFIQCRVILDRATVRLDCIVVIFKARTPTVEEKPARTEVPCLRMEIASALVRMGTTGLTVHVSERIPWWRHQMETFSALLALCTGNSPVPGEFCAQRPVTRRFDVFFVLRLNKRLIKQSWGWWLETPSGSLWRQCNDYLSPLDTMTTISQTTLSDTFSWMKTFAFS